jgi:hypothetical protein
VRSPSGRSASGDWPYPDLDAEARRDRDSGEGRSPSGRSAAGAWPDLDAGRGAGDSRAAAGPLDPDWPGPDWPDPAVADRGLPDRAVSDRDWPDRAVPDRDWPDRDLTARAGADRDGADRDWAAGERSTRAYRITGETGAGAGSRPYDDQDRGRGDEWRGRDPALGRDSGLGRDRALGREPAPGPESAFGREPAPDLGDREPGKRPRGRRGAGRGARHGSRRHGSDGSSGDRPDSDRRDGDRQYSDRRDSSDRWSLPAHDEPPSGPIRSQREVRRLAEPAAWAGDDDPLEPLPPIDGPGRTQNRRSAWRPAEDGGEWSGPASGQDARRSEQLPEYDYEPEYEGDTW